MKVLESTVRNLICMVFSPMSHNLFETETFFFFSTFQTHLASDTCSKRNDNNGVFNRDRFFSPDILIRYNISRNTFMPESFCINTSISTFILLWELLTGFLNAVPVRFLKLISHQNSLYILCLLSRISWIAKVDSQTLGFLGLLPWK